MTTIQATTTPIVTDAKINSLLAEYARRQTRAEHPEGTFDKAGRFWLSEAELTDCCRAIRSPSRAHPWSQMVHGRTLKHLANLRGVDPGAARSGLSKLIAFQRPAKTAPSGLCAICGASWDCDHQIPATAGMLSISIEQASSQFDRHLSGMVRG